MPRGIVTSRLRPSTVIRRCPPLQHVVERQRQLALHVVAGIGMRTPARSAPARPAPARPPDGRPKIDPKKSLKSPKPSQSVVTLGPRPVSGAA